MVCGFGTSLALSLVTHQVRVPRPPAPVPPIETTIGTFERARLPAICNAEHLVIGRPQRGIVGVSLSIELTFRGSDPLRVYAGPRGAGLDPQRTYLVAYDRPGHTWSDWLPPITVYAVEPVRDLAVEDLERGLTQLVRDHCR